MENNVTFHDLLKRIESLEAAAKPERDQQAERASGLERELGSVREQLRVMTEARDAALDGMHKARERSIQEYNLHQSLGRAIYSLIGGEEESYDGCWSNVLESVTHQWHSNQSAADTLERLLKGGRVEIDGIQMALYNESYDTARERDALAAKVADLERRLAESEERERGHVAMIGAKCEEIAELKRRLSEAQSRPAAFDQFGNPMTMITVDSLTDMRRDAERWRMLMASDVGVRLRDMVDTWLSHAEKKPDPPACPVCKSSATKQAVYNSAMWHCVPCNATWPKEQQPEPPKCPKCQCTPRVCGSGWACDNCGHRWTKETRND